MSMSEAMNQAWQVFTDEMYERYGPRDCPCFLCGETVYMSLQGLFSGGVWTTDAELEGPMTAADRGTDCPSSPDGKHEVVWRLGTFRGLAASGGSRTKSAETADFQPCSVVGAPRFELGTSGPPDQPCSVVGAPRFELGTSGPPDQPCSVVGAPRFELGTSGPPDQRANQAAPRPVAGDTLAASSRISARSRARLTRTTRDRELAFARSYARRL
jgi:hypothetical protein